MPEASVIIPAYNNAQYLGEAIESVLCQEYTNFEIIVVNDGSTDETSKIASRYKDQIHYLEKENGGPASARNAGLRISSGEYIAFLDADDLFLQNKLQLQVDYLKLHPDVGVVYSDGFRLKTNSEGQMRTKLLSETGDLLKKFNSSTELFYTLMFQNIFPINNALSRRECIIDVGGFDETLSACEDWDIWFRIAERYNIAYENGEVAVYRVTPGSNSTDFSRNYLEVENVMTKISYSDKFLNVPANILQQFYYRRGIIALGLGNTGSAIRWFKKSLSYPFNRGLSFSALLLSVIFQKNTFMFYKVKRKFFGMRGSAGI